MKEPWRKVEGDLKKRRKKRIKKERKRSEREIKTKKFLHSKGNH